MTADSPAGDATAGKAVRFFWAWLIAATSVSVAGNVAHAVLTAPSGRLQLAAAAAVVPPAVLLGSTHSVALLVRTRRVGFSYWCALAMTVALAGCAFVLSFDALRELATALGMPRNRAWLWPVAIDVSIANSTVSLLSLTPPPVLRDNVIRDSTSLRTVTGIKGDDASAIPDPSPRSRSDRPRRHPTTAGASASQAAKAAESQTYSAIPAHTDSTPPDATAPLEETPALRRWRPAADELIRCGVTSKDPAVVAAVLADHAAGTAPSTIGRRHKVHHSTVGRILAATAHLHGRSASDPTGGGDAVSVRASEI
jgi:hypothetical protein